MMLEGGGDPHRDMKQYYEEWWENPRDPRDFVFRQLNALVRQRLPEGRGKTALDVGSGKGAIVSMLRRRDYVVTAVELNATFTGALRRDFPEVRVIEADVNSLELDTAVDLVTAIEFVQNLDEAGVRRFLENAAGVASYLTISISNRHSMHGLWTAFRRFQKSFVYTYTPQEMESMLEDSGFDVMYREGIGLITPVTLLPDFRLRIVPMWLARVVNRVGDRLLPRICHLYYLEARRRANGRRRS